MCAQNDGGNDNDGINDGDMARGAVISLLHGQWVHCVVKCLCESKCHCWQTRDECVGVCLTVCRWRPKEFLICECICDGDKQPWRRACYVPHVVKKKLSQKSKK